MRGMKGKEYNRHKMDEGCQGLMGIGRKKLKAQGVQWILGVSGLPGEVVVIVFKSMFHNIMESRDLRFPER